MTQVLAIAAGGAIGALLRYWTSTAVHSRLGSGFPYGTLAVNVTGSLLMGPLQDILVLAAMIAVGFALDPVLATLALAVAPMLALSSRFFGKRLKHRAKLGREA